MDHCKIFRKIIFAHVIFKDHVMNDFSASLSPGFQAVLFSVSRRTIYVRKFYNHIVPASALAQEVDFL